MREFDAIAVGKFEVLCHAADAAIWHQTRRFGAEEMLAATAVMSSFLQLERPPEHVSGEVRGALESAAGTAYTPLQDGRGVGGERQRLTPQETVQMPPAAVRGVEAEEQLRDFDCGFEPRGQVDAQRESQCAVAQLEWRLSSVLDAAHDEGIALLHPLAGAPPVHIAQRELELGQQECVDHEGGLVDCTW